MSLFRHLAAAFAYARFVPRYNEEAEAAWTKEDSQVYDHFMKTPTGQKLAILRENFAYKCALSATQASQHQKHRCGWASGVRAQTLREQSYYTLSPASAHDASAESDGASELRELYAP